MDTEQTVATSCKPTDHSFFSVMIGGAVYLACQKCGEQRKIKTTE